MKVPVVQGPSPVVPLWHFGTWRSLPILRFQLYPILLPYCLSQLLLTSFGGFCLPSPKKSVFPRVPSIYPVTLLSLNVWINFHLNSTYCTYISKWACLSSGLSPLWLQVCLCLQHLPEIIKYSVFPWDRHHASTASLISSDKKETGCVEGCITGVVESSQSLPFI